MKNRTIIGIVCIVLALIVTFAVAPMVNKMADNRTDIVRMKKDVDQGFLISEDDIEIVTVGSHGLASGTITKKEDVVGKFAACDLKVGDALFPSKLSNDSDSADDVFRTLAYGEDDLKLVLLAQAEFADLLVGRQFKELHQSLVPLLIEKRELHLVEPFMVIRRDRRKE